AQDRHVVWWARVGQQRAQLGVAGDRQLRDRARIEHALGVVLGLLHVGLVERIDLERPSDDRYRIFGEEEHASEIRGAVRAERDRRMAGRGQLLDRGVELLVGLL